MKLIIDLSDEPFSEINYIGKTTENANIQIDGEKKIVEELKEVVEQFCEEKDYFIR